jgi:hypothetical protein
LLAESDEHGDIGWVAGMGHSVDIVGNAGDNLGKRIEFYTCCASRLS